MLTTAHHRRRTVIAAAMLIFAAAGPCAAQNYSSWDNDMRSSARLVAGKARSIAHIKTLRAGVEIKLEPNWKTYSREPDKIAPNDTDDYGVPPRFDFGGSENMKTIKVLWPKPERFPGQGITTVGYKGYVMFPVHVVPADPKKPVVLRLKLDYAVCEKLCVPAKANLELILTGTADAAGDHLVSEAEARVSK